MISARPKIAELVYQLYARSLHGTVRSALVFVQGLPFVRDIPKQHVPTSKFFIASLLP